MKTALVAGSAGFIGGHLVRRLQGEGYRVVGADIEPEKNYGKADTFYWYDLRSSRLCDIIFNMHKIDVVYNLACLMGGMGYIGDEKHNYAIMVGSSQIVLNIINSCVSFNVPKLFYSSSACVYNMYKQETTDHVALHESDAYPAMPDLVYGWQKLFSEQCMQAAKDKIDTRIARFHNIFGIEGVWDGGKEKYPAAICRKVALAKDGESISVWGDGKATRSYLNVDECLHCVMKLMASDITEPINIGSDESISVDDLAKMVIDISGKRLSIDHDLSKPQGVRGRNSDNTLIREKLGYAPIQDLRSEMEKLYFWINNQINS